MASKLRRRFRLFGLILGLVILALSIALYWALPIATGYAAKTMCSCVFIADRDPASVSALELSNVPYNLATTEIDTENQVVTASVWGLRTKQAVHRPGLGCSVVSETTVEALMEQTPTLVRAQATYFDSMYWPTGDLDTLSFPEGVDQAALAAALTAAFSPNEEGQNPNTRGVVVVYQDKIIAEQYAEDIDAQTPQRGWSMTKSVTNALIGVLVQQGKLTRDQPAPIAEWQGEDDPRKAITIDHLHRLSDGFDFTENYFGRTDATNMLYMKAGAGDFAVQSKLKYEPGTVWNYSSGTANILSRLIYDQFDSQEAYLSFPYQALFDKIGMRSTLMEVDASGKHVGSSFMFATPRDWARFGLLYLHDGMWNGEQILPEGWVTYTQTPTSTCEPGIYGAQFWHAAAEKPEGWYSSFYWSGVPKDAYLAEGFEGQSVTIIPSLDLEVVRLGVTHGIGAWDLGKFIASVVAAIPHDPAQLQP